MTEQEVFKMAAQKGFVIKDRGIAVNCFDGEDFICTSVEWTRAEQFSRIAEFLKDRN